MSLRSLTFHRFLIGNWGHGWTYLILKEPLSFREHGSPSIKEQVLAWRTLVNFMLDLHVEKHGYREIFPPFMVNADCMQGTGQLPKFADDMFKLEGAICIWCHCRVPLTNLYRDEILNAADLPFT